MAQQVEHVLGKDEVTGSSPVSSSKTQSTDNAPCFFIRLHTIIYTVKYAGCICSFMLRYAAILRRFAPRGVRMISSSSAEGSAGRARPW